MKRNAGMKEGSVYELDGRVPLKKALPLGIQHVLAMFLGNVSPLLIVCGLLDIALDMKTVLIQNAMFVAAIATLLQLYPIRRFGSRLPVTLPERIYGDAELLDMFAEYSKKKTLIVVTQFNHPRELTEKAALAVRSLLERGIQVRNQTVLLRGVNDSGEVLGELLSGLTRIGVSPYYIFQCRPVTGVKGRFQVPLAEGCRIVDEAKSRQNGIGKSVRYAMSHPRGKIEIIGRLPGSGEMIFKFHQAKNPDELARIFTLPLEGHETWLDDELRPI